MLRIAAPLILAISLPGFALSVGQSSGSSINAPGVTDSVSRLDAAQKALATGHPEEALKQLDILAAITPEPPGVERLRGFAYYQEKNMAAAEAAFARAVAQAPADRESMQMQGVALYSLGRPAEAVPLLEQAHVAVPSANVDPNYVLGVCYIAVRRYDDARGAFAAQYGFPPDSAPAYLLAARLLRQENPALAEDFAHKALTLQPDLPLAHLLLGEIALARAQFPEAIAEFNLERELSPLDGTLYQRLGDAYLRSGNDEKALEALTRAVLLEPKASGPYVLLGKVMLDQRNFLLASIYLEQALSMDPGNSMAHALLAQAYRGAGRIADADKQSDAAAQLQNGRGAGGAKLESVH